MVVLVLIKKELFPFARVALNQKECQVNSPDSFTILLKTKIHHSEFLTKRNFFRSQIFLNACFWQPNLTSKVNLSSCLQTENNKNNKIPPPKITATDFNGIRTQNHLVHKRTLSHLIELCCEYLSVQCTWLYVLIMSGTRFRANLYFIVA